MQTAKVMHDEYQEPVADRRLREGVDRADDAARVRNVPRIAKQNVAKTSHMFHTFNMPRFSCIITECRNAVPVSQGMSEAFSTGIPSPVSAPSEN